MTDTSIIVYQKFDYSYKYHGMQVPTADSAESQSLQPRFLKSP